MSRWLRIGPLSIIGGVSLASLYVAAGSGARVGTALGLAMAPGYLWRAVTGSALHALLPALADTFWTKELALAAVYMIPLLAADAVIARLRRSERRVTFAPTSPAPGAGRE
jgi:hypothetical protein